MGDKTRRSRLKKLDVLYIVHNPLDCLIVYFCVCFAFLRIVYDIYEIGPSRDVYVIALCFTVVMGSAMFLWARKAFKRLNLENVL